ncbi:HypC/HybG/HupF family hydrogenase formation chaperone [Paracoccus sp. p4-l81]|uniref:HypC/HybG/HupF family hydrogenase formation chaperone n=1 Tax=unclassified Paracoccus (in: a-proteobacteria) TaxID=2688777 RepID=UPI0035B7E88D
MCIGIPARLTQVTGIAGQTEDGALIDLSLTPDARAGDWVLTFLGASRSVIDAQTARLIGDALAGLAAVMAGGDAGAAFADLEARSPQLPPHLQAALDAGHSTG